MICVTLAEITPETCLRVLKGIDFAEIRIDRIAKADAKSIREIFSRHSRLIATCRPGRVGPKKKYELLAAAILGGACFVDLELDWNAPLRAKLIKLARHAGCQVIISFHDYRRTPPRPDLERLIGRCFRAGADIAKIACLVRSKSDNARLLGLLDSDRPLVVVGLGDLGKLTRVVAPLLGGRFTFASRGKGKEVVEGQIPETDLATYIARLRDV